MYFYANCSEWRANGAAVYIGQIKSHKIVTCFEAHVHELHLKYYWCGKPKVHVQDNWSNYELQQLINFT